MKLIAVIISIALVISSCGVGNYTISSGKGDNAYLSFQSDDKLDISVLVDDSSYQVQTIKSKPYRVDRNIKRTSLNSIEMAVGRHKIKVIDKNSTVLLEKEIMVSSAEHKIIKL
ncbi:MAG: hypothetical protein ACI3Y2_01325 [Candidatus Egerieousia sp.]